MAPVELTDDMLSMLEMALNDNSYMSHWYFDLKTDKVTFTYEDGDPEEEKELRQLIEEDPEGERFIPIEPEPSREGWQQMKDFILDQDDLDDTVQSLLLRAIQGRGAFGRFKDAIYDVGISDRWFAYKNRQDREKALQWLKDRELITDEGVAKGIKMHEDGVARRKRIENAQKAMNKGAQVVCINNYGHGDKITPGKAYDVLDERPDDLLIRIEDDRGKIIWLPKSHFELV